ncbi:MAG: glycosyltransferase family 9 protein [Bacteroides sp.]|nr:glycosyltransferase family 9 protein [Bacteroides sp.]
MAKILVIRLSAIGDVAMTVPVIHSIATQYPQHQITVLSRANMSALFATMPPNVSFYGADIKGKHRGLKGLGRLYQELKAGGFDCIADLHDVLRTQYLRLRFRWDGKKTAHIHKGRKEKRQLIRKSRKVKQPLETSFHRYARVFEVLGFPVTLRFTSVFGEGKGDITPLLPITGEKGKRHWIGIAPFATHTGKIYPPEKMKEVVAALAARPDTTLFLFGGGKKETDILTAWEAEYPAAVCIAGKLKWADELALMSHLDVMVSMDSGNMHLASMAGTPVVSIWGATHPYAGFMGWKQAEANALQVDLDCRPCSIFGNKPCYRGDYACLNGISPDMIVKRITSFLV